MKAPRTTSPSRRRLTIGVMVTVAVAVLFALPTVADLYVDLRWFRTLGYEQVFTSILTTKLLLGVAVAALLAALVLVNLRVAERVAHAPPTFKLPGQEGRLPLDLAPVVRRVLRGVGLLVALMAGVAAASHWTTWLSFHHASSFGAADPLFGRDVGFYVFTLPLLEALETLGFWALGLSVAVSAITYVVRGAIVVDGRAILVHSRARLHLHVLAAALFALLCFDAWLSTLALVYSSLGPVAGASYADVSAKLPALHVQLAVAAVGVVLVAVSATRKRLVLPATAAVLYLAVTILGVWVYPAMVHRFAVLPNEAAKEASYIRHNIAATRAAYGLARVVERELSGEVSLTMAEIEQNRATIDNVRVWDHKPLLDTFAQIQEIRTYYEFASVDNDRYVLDGRLTQVMLSPRELAAESLPNRTWINERFTFTHGYGLTMGPVNRATSDGLPVLHVQDIPPVSAIPELQITRPEIYFGEMSNDYVLTRTKARAFDYPAGERNVYSVYEGRAGVQLDSFVTLAAVSLRIGSFKLLLSDDVDDQSRVLLHRNILERVARVAPFLRYDRDPYMVVRRDGSLIWILDAYTTSSRYPYSEPSPEGINYIRNSVKVTIDAYHGTVTLYAADARDPLLRTWQSIFPGLFRPLADMPADVRAHLRYPEDLFRVQTEIFTVYHMDSPELVYNGEDQWEVPAVIVGEASTPLEPYYAVMRLPGERDAEFIQMLPFTPKRKQNLAAWMVARMDGAHLGELVVYRFPKSRLVFGPAQIMNRINQDAEISRQISLWDQRGSEAILGTLLVIPIEESLIYVCPLYLRSSGGRIPQLKRVIVVYENHIAMEETLDAAVHAVFRSASDVAAAQPSGDSTAQPAAEIPEPAGEPAPAPVAAAQPRAVSDTLSPDPSVRAKQHYDRAVAAQRRGDWAAYGEELRRLGEVLDLLGSRAGRPRGTQDAGP